MKRMTGRYRLYLENMQNYGKNYNTFGVALDLPKVATKNSIHYLLERCKNKSGAAIPKRSFVSEKTNASNEKGNASDHGKENKKAISPVNRKINVVTPPKKKMKLRNK